jgi:Flp pilus assembly protein TadD
VYARTLSAGFIWDDDGHITRADLRSWAGLVRIWFEPGATQQYYPLLHSAFWLEHRLWGDAPAGYHAVNILLHATAACLFASVLRRLAVPGAWFAALLFTVHPVCVESVAWITEQKNTLSTVFYLAAALAYLRHDREKTLRSYLVASLLFACALLSKTVTATLPAALLVVFWWREPATWVKRIPTLLPWFALGAAAGLFTAAFEHTYIGAQGADFGFSLLERGLIAGRVVWFYFGKLLWPADLVFIYPRWHIDASDPLQWFFPLAAIAALGTLALLARRFGRARGVLAVALLFGGTLFPVLGFLNVYPFVFSFVADHFQYLATLPVFALAAGTLCSFRSPAPVASPAAVGVTGFPLHPPGRILAAMLIAGVLASLAWRQTGMYRDKFTLWETTLSRNDDAWLAHNNIAMVLTEAGQPAEAIPHLQRALALRPGYAVAESNLGDDLTRLGRAAEALPHFQRALELQPDYAEAHNNYGVALVALARTADAIAQYEAALRARPAYAAAHRNLGLALASGGRNAEAISHFESAVRLQPDFAEAELALGIALMLENRWNEAVAHFERAIELQPESANNHFMYGRALAAQGHPDQARAHLQKAKELGARTD